MPYFSRLICIFLFLTFAFPVFSQSNQQNKSEINLFLDCGGCDMNFIKTEINYINFVPDRFSANVYILPGSQSTGSGGEQITLFIYGQKEFEGLDDTLKLYRTSVETEAEFRIKVVKYLKMALVRYIARTDLNEQLNISMKSKDSNNKESFKLVEKNKDKWNYWVYNVGISGNFNNDDVSKFSKFSGSVDASRVTEKMKCYFFANLNSSQRKYIFDGVESKFPNTGYGLNATFVKSINSHWSAGGYGNYQYSTFSNFKKRIAFEPAIEYSFYKYADAVKKSITFFYKIGPSHNEYIDSGYYDSPAHLLWSQSLSLRMAFTQKWGTLNFSATGNGFLNDFYLNNSKINGYSIRQVSISCNLNIRIIKGLSANVYSVAEFTEGIYPNITRTAFTRDELLTNTRQYPTSKFLYCYFGLNYRFGSIYNNIVNPRFDSNNNF